MSLYTEKENNLPEKTKKQKVNTAYAERFLDRLMRQEDVKDTLKSKIKKHKSDVF